jgi:PAS domain S-box-containing protein
LKLRIYILTIFSLIAFALAVNYISISFKKSIIEVKKSQLLSISHALSSHIETYIHALGAATKAASLSHVTLNAFVSFEKSYNSLSGFTTSPAKYLKDNYIKKNPFKLEERYKLINIKGNKSSYNASHTKFHNFFLEIQKQHGFYDIYLIDKNGNIIYSLKKENDFGTSVIHGDYGNTGLSRAYIKALELESTKITFEDFKPYAPSKNIPSAFIATPIYEDNILVGVFAVQVPTNKIDAIMSFSGKRKESGLGETGEAYIVGEDLLMRSSSKFITGASIGNVKVDSPSVQKALTGMKGLMQIKSYHEIDVYSGYVPVNIFQHRWALITEIDIDGISEGVQEGITLLFIQGLFIVIIMVMLYTRIFYKNLMLPLELKYSGLQNSIKIKESQLSASRSMSEEYQLAFDLVSIISITNPKGFITHANDNFCKHTGYSIDELIGQSHHMLSHPDTPKELFQNLWKTITSKRIWKGQITNINKHKEAYTIDLTIIPILDENGEIKEFISTVYK